MAGRHWRWPAGQSFLQKLVWQQQRTKQSMTMHFKQCMHQSHLLSCLWLKGTWASILGPPITHFHAWWPKESSVHVDMECNAHNQARRPNLYHKQFKRPSMHANAMQLRHTTKYATWTTQRSIQSIQKSCKAWSKHVNDKHTRCNLNMQVCKACNIIPMGPSMQQHTRQACNTCEGRDLH